ncbi:MAG: hypothetical protein HYV36_05295 [Lentisphaerae bacterium]|nr:hypothetical protein [Lentisphaerota bacterium]
MNRMRKAALFFSAAAVGLFLLLLLHTRGHLIEGVFLRYLIVWIPVVLLLERLQVFAAARGQAPAVALRVWPVIGLLIFLILFFFSSTTDHYWFYFVDWLPRTGFGWFLFESGMGRFVLLTALLTPLLVTPGLRLPAILLVLLLASMTWCGALFLKTTGGAPLYTDDHASFLFRLWEYVQTRLQLINYNPYWNAGVVESHFTQTGTAALGLVAWPVWSHWPIDQVYTPVLLAVFIVLVPLLAVGSLRIMGANGTAQCCAGFMALGVNQPYFLWLLHYGTVGACLASACILPVSACLFRVMMLGRREWWLAVVLIGAICFCLMWPPAAVMILALVLAFLINWRHWSWPKFRFLLLCAAVILLLHLRRGIVLLMEMGVFHPRGPTLALPGGYELSQDLLVAGWETLVDYLRHGHPLILFLGIGGVVVIAHPLVRRWFGPIVLGLLLLTGWGFLMLPDLQLHRMVIPLFFAAIAPAALMAADILRSHSIRLALLRAAVVVILALGAWNAALMFGNEGRATYNPMPREARALAAWLKADGADGGRVLFAGSTIHGYFEAHVAFLPYLGKREMMACDYYHFSPGAVEYDYPPKAWRQSPDTIALFLELFNVTTVTTCHEEHRAFFAAHPEQYRLIPGLGAGDGLAVFKVLRPASKFLENSGTVTATFNCIRVELRQSERNAVIKYTWDPGLKVTPPATLYPAAAGPGVTLIGIRPNGLTKLEISFPSWL